MLIQLHTFIVIFHLQFCYGLIQLLMSLFQIDSVMV